MLNAQETKDLRIRTQESEEYYYKLYNPGEAELNPLIRVEVPPKGRLCNPGLNEWCKYLYCDYCIKYNTLLWTKGGIGGGFLAQEKIQECKENKPKQIDMFGKGDKDEQ